MSASHFHFDTFAAGGSTSPQLLFGLSEHKSWVGSTWSKQVLLPVSHGVGTKAIGQWPEGQVQPGDELRVRVMGQSKRKDPGASKQMEVLASSPGCPTTQALVKTGGWAHCSYECKHSSSKVSSLFLSCRFAFLFHLSYSWTSPLPINRHIRMAICFHRGSSGARNLALVTSSITLWKQVTRRTLKPSTCRCRGFCSYNGCSVFPSPKRIMKISAWK